METNIDYKALYEKKYTDLVAKLKEWHDGLQDGAPAKETLEFILPDLKESEDERIRKQCIKLLKDAYSTKHEALECIAYLERQKEPEVDESTRRMNENWMKRYFHEPVMTEEMLEGKLEQKPSEKQDYSGLTDFERAIHRGFLCAGVENVPVTIIKETAQDCLAHIKPAEWSEEDEEMIERLIRHTQKEFDELCNDRYGHQEIISDLKESCRERMNWLENRLKSLRPSWKPSEEQMKALKEVIPGLLYPLDTKPPVNHLKELYEQLKKL